MNKKEYIKELREYIDDVKAEIAKAQDDVTKLKSGTREFTRNRLRKARLDGMWDALYCLVKKLEVQDDEKGKETS